MKRRLVFDIETNGLLPDLTKIHCLVVKDLDTGEVHEYVGADVPYGLNCLEVADLIAGHNIISFDIPAIQKLYPQWNPKGLVRDTIVLTRLIWPHIKDTDFNRAKLGKLPKKLIGAHSLEAWGHRLGRYKGDYKGGWEEWSQDMQDYCVKDVEVTHTLYTRIAREIEEWGVPLEDPNPPPRKDCVELEHRVAQIVFKVMEHGFAFDKAQAIDLVAKLTQRKLELETEFQKWFPPEIVKEKFTPKVNNKKFGYVKGKTIVKTHEILFNPSSRQHVGRRLMKLGWKPKAYGKDGHPTVDDEVLSALPYKEAKLLAEYFMIDKRLGQIANGNEAWLKREKNGRIHGRITPGGAHTGRMTHSSPNLAQVPARRAPYGEECRKCFTADKGHKLVGVDADALEGRDLAGYMAAWDGGDYIKTILEGKKEEGTDQHSVNAKAIGCDRDTAKTFFYALIYGAGDGKLGAIVGNPRQGKRARERLLEGVPALGALVRAVQSKFKKYGYIVGLDGRRLTARGEHSALNTLLQSAGAIQMKRALVILYDTLADKGWVFGEHYAIVGLIHDEICSTVKPELAEEYGETACEAIREAGRYYSFKCPLEAQYQVGPDWSATH